MQTPSLEPGLTYVAQPDGRGALATLVREAETAETLWIDARGAASTYALTADADRTVLRGLKIARAFTAHQHHALVGRAVAVASGRTDLVVAPNVAELYDAADGSAAERDRLYEATCSTLASLADALDVPVLTSAPAADEDSRETIRERADREFTCRQTDLGYAIDAPGFTQPGYWRDDWWQTTIPYWVDLCGAAEPIEATTPDPVAVAIE